MSSRLRQRYEKRSAALDELLKNLDLPEEVDVRAFLATLQSEKKPAETPRIRAEDAEPVSPSLSPEPTPKKQKFVAGKPPASQAELEALLVRWIVLSDQFAAPACSVSVTSALRGYYRSRSATLAELSDFINADRVSEALASLASKGLLQLLQGLQPTSAPNQIVVERLTLPPPARKDWEEKLKTQASLAPVPWPRTGKRKRSPKPSQHHQPVDQEWTLRSDQPTSAWKFDAKQPNDSPTVHASMTVDELVQAPTHVERQLISQGETLRRLIAAPTAKQKVIQNRFQNKKRQLNATYCPVGSREDCARASPVGQVCSRLHFRKVIRPWTNPELGDCSYLDTCRHPSTCKYVHYTADLSQEQRDILKEMQYESIGTDTKRLNEFHIQTQIDYPPQWICCDLRTINLKIFRGIAKVVMADPPWDIHMDLPYGTMTDDEMRALPVADVHDEGMLFLWVTGRAMELARECMSIWGYRRVEEIIWCKTNQLQRIIRTGRTGHWINHSKEHCLVGIKGNPTFNKNIDCDVIVSEVRETSRKPDEIYNLIERMCPDSLKVELFGRMHNTHRNWITLGNQLEPTRIANEKLLERFNDHLQELEEAGEPDQMNIDHPMKLYDPATEIDKKDASSDDEAPKIWEQPDSKEQAAPPEEEEPPEEEFLPQFGSDVLNKKAPDKRTAHTYTTAGVPAPKKEPKS